MHERALTMDLACDERADFATLVAGLSTQQWDQPSLCSRWRVRDVAAHVISFDELGLWGTAKRFVRGGLWPHRVNEIGAREYAGRSPADIAALMRAYIPPRGLTAGFGGMIALVDGLIHQQDIRRPLDLPRDIDAQRLTRVLDYALTVPAVRGARRARGARLIATDVDWTHGTGREVRGPGEALLMAMAGRTAALDDLTGPGLDVLSRNISR